jgi:hypothetical protein
MVVVPIIGFGKPCLIHYRYGSTFSLKLTVIVTIIATAMGQQRIAGLGKIVTIYFAMI